MARLVMISIKPEYAQRIIEGSKTIELRRTTFGLERGDIILVYESSPKQTLSFWFRIGSIEMETVDSMWDKNKEKLGINEDSYREYFNGTEMAIGFHVADLNILEKAISLSQLAKTVAGFTPPQGIILIRGRHGRFEDLIKHISPPLPDSLFRQMSIFD